MALNIQRRECANLARSIDDTSATVQTTAKTLHNFFEGRIQEGGYNPSNSNEWKLKAC